MNLNQIGGEHFSAIAASSNITVKWDWLTAGFAHFQPAPYLER
jgi:hypothetical protein